MTPERWAEVKRIVFAAEEQPTSERRSFVREACAGDEALYDEVCRLLDKQDTIGDFMATPAEPPATPGIGARIGAYTLREVIGEGGMGLVYLADQERPERTVALKVLRHGAVGPRTLRRFEHEAEILGRLQHQGIAQIFEAGTFDLGSGAQPFFAMEYVQGRGLLEAIKDLDVAGRLRVFVEVCRAVHHAHQQGVIHRDLKPPNVIVDESGQPKVLDFGVARAVDADVQMTTTAAGQLVGTLPYMSPEQVSGRPDRIDTRSDVYALGVLAYEMLAGVLPHDLSDRSVPDAVLVIRDEEPTALGTVCRECRGDLETIVAKALEKEPERRYDSAAALADDVERFLADAPIMARPASTTYQLRKFARRHRELVAAGLGIVTILVAATAAMSVMLWQSIRSEREKERQIDRLEHVERFYNAVVAPMDGRVRSGRMSDMLGDMARTLPRAFPEDPDIQAKIQAHLSVGIAVYGRHDEALRMARESVERHQALLGDMHSDTLTARVCCAFVERLAGDVEVADETLDDVLAIVLEWLEVREIDEALVARLGEAMQHAGRADDAITLRKAWLDTTIRNSVDDGPVLGARRQLVASLIGSGQYAELEAQCRILLESDHHPDRSMIFGALVESLVGQGRLDEAEALIVERLDGIDGRGPRDMSRVQMISSATDEMARHERHDVAERILERLLRRVDELEWDDPALRRGLLERRAMALSVLGRADEARELDEIIRSMPPARPRPPRHRPD